MYIYNFCHTHQPIHFLLQLYASSYLDDILTLIIGDVTIGKQCHLQQMGDYTYVIVPNTFISLSVFCSNVIRLVDLNDIV